MNILHLRDENLVGKLRGLWIELNTQVQLDGSMACPTFLKGLYQSKRITRAYGKVKAQKRKSKELELQRILADAQLAPESDPQSVTHQITLAEAEDLKDFVDGKLEWMLETAQVNWLMEDGRCPTHVSLSFKNKSI